MDAQATGGAHASHDGGVGVADVRARPKPEAATRRRRASDLTPSRVASGATCFGPIPAAAPELKPEPHPEDVPLGPRAAHSKFRRRIPIPHRHPLENRRRRRGGGR